MIEILSAFLPKDRIYEMESMKRHTSFRIGGPADYLVEVQSELEIKNLVTALKTKGVPIFVMGNGTNLLVSDKGIRGVVIKIGSGFSEFHFEGETVYAQSGMLLSTLAKRILEQSLEGFEFASGIPGSIGGAITMNAGAYGGEMKDIVKSVRVLKQDGMIEEIPGEEMDFAYRNSKVISEQLVVLGVTFRLKKGNKEEIQDKMQDYTNKRNTKQPVSAASAGSTFKRPEGYFAGKLIDESGLRGVCHRGAQVSDLHCGFVINRDNATCQDIVELISFIKKTVYDKFGVCLEEEVKIVGEK